MFLAYAGLCAAAARYYGDASLYTGTGISALGGVLVVAMTYNRRALEWPNRMEEALLAARGAATIATGFMLFVFCMILAPARRN